jgi:hypothetical protein
MNHDAAISRFFGHAQRRNPSPALLLRRLAPHTSGQLVLSVVQSSQAADLMISCSFELEGWGLHCCSSK